MEKSTAKRNIGRFFYETFRVRTKDDYAEVFTRGLKKRGEGEGSRVYPWFYARVFLLFLALFTVFALVVCAVSQSSWSMYRLTLFFAGGLFVDLAFLVLLFELAPTGKVSLLWLTLIMIIGGSAADFLSAAFWEIMPSFGGYGDAIAAGISEEVAKAVPTLIIIAVCKKRSDPYMGFLTGAAVGTLFSITENAVYIANSSSQFMMIITAIARGFSGIVSHALWAGIIGWAFCRFCGAAKMPLFFLISIAVMAVHTCWDLPLSTLWLSVDYCLCAAAGAAVGLVIISGSGRKTSPEEPPEIHEAECEPVEAHDKAEVQDTETAAESDTAAPQAAPNESLAPNPSRVSLIIFATLLCFLLLAFAGLFDIKEHVKVEFGSTEEFVLWAQNGMYFQPADPERPYDEELANFETYSMDGLMIRVSQKVLIANEGWNKVGKPYYIYSYRRDPNGRFVLENVSLRIVDHAQADSMYYLRTESFLSEGEPVSISYFPILSEVQTGRLTFSDGRPVYILNRERYYPSLTTIILAATVVMFSVAEAVLYTVLRRRERKNDREAEKTP